MSPRYRGGRGPHGRGPCPQRIQRFVEPALLLLLHQQPTHGYDLIEGLAHVGFVGYPVDTSVIYRTLRALEEQGMVTSNWETAETAGPPRRIYRLTPAGDAYLSAWIEDLQATDRVLHAFLEAYHSHMRHGKGEYH